MAQEQAFAVRNARQRDLTRTSLHRFVEALVKPVKVAAASLVACLLCVTLAPVFAQSASAKYTYDDASRLKSATYAEAITNSSAAIASLRRLTAAASQVTLERGTFANTRPTLLGDA